MAHYQFSKRENGMNSIFILDFQDYVSIEDLESIISIFHGNYDPHETEKHLSLEQLSERVVFHTTRENYSQVISLVNECASYLNIEDLTDDASEALSYSYIKLENYNCAEEILNRLYIKYSENIQVINNYAICLAYLHDFNEAYKILSQIIDKNWENSILIKNWIYCGMKSGLFSDIFEKIRLFQASDKNAFDEKILDIVYFEIRSKIRENNDIYEKNQDILIDIFGESKARTLPNVNIIEIKTEIAENNTKPDPTVIPIKIKIQKLIQKNHIDLLKTMYYYNPDLVFQAITANIKSVNHQRTFFFFGFFLFDKFFNETINDKYLIPIIKNHVQIPKIDYNFLITGLTIEQKHTIRYKIISICEKLLISENSLKFRDIIFYFGFILSKLSNGDRKSLFMIKKINNFHKLNLTSQIHNSGNNHNIKCKNPIQYDLIRDYIIEDRIQLFDLFYSNQSLLLYNLIKMEINNAKERTFMFMVIFTLDKFFYKVRKDSKLINIINVRSKKIAGSTWMCIQGIDIDLKEDICVKIIQICDKLLDNDNYSDFKELINFFEILLKRMPCNGEKIKLLLKRINYRNS